MCDEIWAAQFKASLFSPKEKIGKSKGNNLRWNDQLNVPQIMTTPKIKRPKTQSHNAHRNLVHNNMNNNKLELTPKPTGSQVKSTADGRRGNSNRNV